LEVDRLRIKKGARSIFPRKAAARPVNGASLYLRHYETFAILGPSGSGKSKLLESIAGLHRPLSGRILLNGHDVTFARGRRLKRLRQTVQIVFQEASAVLDKDRKVHEILSESLKIAGQKNIVLDLELERLGLPSELANAWADQLSPGEAQLVDVCRRLILKPELLIIDEPRVAGIDVDGGLLFGVLRSFLSAKRSVLIATSDPSVARSADRVGILLGGRIIEFGSSRRVLETPSHPATRAFLRGERLPLIDPRAHPTGCTYANFCDKQEFPRCQEKEPALAPHPSRAQQGSRQRVACFHPLD
jgi:peptide/nickel transport system ATP-binding protein